MEHQSDTSTFIIYDCNMFIIQATKSILKFLQNLSLMITTSKTHRKSFFFLNFLAKNISMIQQRCWESYPINFVLGLLFTFFSLSSHLQRYFWILDLMLWELSFLPTDLSLPVCMLQFIQKWYFDNSISATWGNILLLDCQLTSHYVCDSWFSDNDEQVDQ